MEYLLEVEHVLKHKGDFCLMDINFNLEPGYIMGLVGPNGSGKSTLIQLISGIYRMEEGAVRIGGADISQQEKEAKEQIAFVLDENPFIENFSPLDNARLYGRYYKQWEESTFIHYLNQFEVNKKKPLKKLSKGMVIKFQLAFALAHGASLFIMDEPAAGLDPVFRKDLLELMSELIADGQKSILFSTHLTDELDRIADYITFIKEGRQIFSLSKEKMTDACLLVKGSREQIVNLPAERTVGTKILENTAEALIKNTGEKIDNSLLIQRPVIEDIMWYLSDR